MTRKLVALVALVMFSAGLAACGDTWHGMKQDTGENLEKTGQAIEGAGEKVKPNP